MTSLSATTHSHFLIAQESEEETREVWLERYNIELCNENIVLRNCLKTKQQQQEIVKEQAAQEIAELKEKYVAEIAALKQEMGFMKDETARVRVCNIRMMREAQTLREQFGYD
jgi:GH43 family beta-xylosidase